MEKDFVAKRFSKMLSEGRFTKSEGNSLKSRFEKIFGEPLDWKIEAVKIFGDQSNVEEWLFREWGENNA